MAGLFKYWKPAASEGRPMLTLLQLPQADGWEGFTTECR